MLGEIRILLRVYEAGVIDNFLHIESEHLQKIVLSHPAAIAPIAMISHTFITKNMLVACI